MRFFSSPLAMRLATAAIRLDVGDGLFAEPVDFLQPGLRRVNDFGERAELIDQRFGQRLDVAARQAAKQQHLQQFIVVERIRPGKTETLAQPLAMAEIMRRGGLGPIVGLVGLAGHGANHAVACRFYNLEL